MQTREGVAGQDGVDRPVAERDEVDPPLAERVSPGQRVAGWWARRRTEPGATEWGSEWKPLAWIAAIFLVFYFLPVGNARFDGAV
ncbi:MAG: hypothetical protein WEB88_12660, partial [Gemmatimonadota bacterium]